MCRNGHMGRHPLLNTLMSSLVIPRYSTNFIFRRFAGRSLSFGRNSTFTMHSTDTSTVLAFGR